MIGNPPKPLFFDLASFVDDFPLGDGTITVHDDSGAFVKVTGTTMANRNPMRNALYMSAEQLARLMQRENRRFTDYASQHPGMAWCGDCAQWHPRSEFSRDSRNNNGLYWRCKTSDSRAKKDSYAAKHAARIGATPAMVVNGQGKKKPYAARRRAS